MSAWTDEAHAEAYRNDSPVLFVEAVQVKIALQDHACTLCGRTIEIGRSYNRQVGMSRGDARPWVLKEHFYC